MPYLIHTGSIAGEASLTEGIIDQEEKGHTPVLVVADRHLVAEAGSRYGTCQLHDVDECCCCIDHHIINLIPSFIQLYCKQGN